MRETGTCIALLALSFGEPPVEVPRVVLRYAPIVSSRKAFPQQHSVRVPHASEHLVAVSGRCEIWHRRRDCCHGGARRKTRSDGAATLSFPDSGMDSLASRNLYYVLLPLTLVMILSGFLRHYLSSISLLNPTPKQQSAKVVREQSAALLLPPRVSY